MLSSLLLAAAIAVGTPLPNLTPAQQAAFNDGRTEFTDVETVADGLGPVFNGRSCAECHNIGATGGAGTQFVTRFGASNGNTFDPLASLGGSLIQVNGIGPADGSAHQFQGETVPASANVVAHRRTTALFGLGFVDATPDSEFFAMAQMQSARRNGVSGHAPLVDNISAGMKNRREVRMERAEPDIVPIRGRRLHERDGYHQPAVPG